MYRVGFDEAAEGRNDPWMMTIPCRFGTIYPHRGEMLALELDRHPKMAKQLAAIPGIALHQDGDDQKTFLFPVSVFDQLAVLVEPRKVRRLNEEQRERLIQAGLSFRFGDGAGASSGERQAPRTAESDQEVA
jgi:hypothetical protein